MTIAEDFSTMLDLFGEEVTGTPAGNGTAKTFKAVVDTGFANQEDHPGSGTRFATATITVSGNDWTPDGDDIFTVRGNEWMMAPEGWEQSRLNSDSPYIYKGHLERTI